MAERLIDANALTRFSDGYGLIVYASDIDIAPTIDAVRVVRCKDCLSWKRDGLILPDGKPIDIGTCEMHLDPEGDLERITAEADYCSFGERKEVMG